MATRTFQFLHSPDLVVIPEEKEDPQYGKITLFPHTDQLHHLWKAINEEFLRPLPNRIARVDRRAGPVLKLSRHAMAVGFCDLVNRSRSDQILLHQLPDLDMVSQICIAQKVTRAEKGGSVFHYRFYGGEKFFVEIRANGKRISFTSHVLDRAKVRVPSTAGNEHEVMLESFFENTWIRARVNRSPALIAPLERSFLAFPYEETGRELLLKSCWTVEQIDSFDTGDEVRVYDHHYSDTYTPPINRHWDPKELLEQCVEWWRNRTPAMASVPPLFCTWEQATTKLKNLPAEFAWDEHAPLLFLDNIPGPHLYHVPRSSIKNDEFKDILDQALAANERRNSSQPP